MRAPGRAGGTAGMRKLSAVPAIAIATTAIPTIQRRPCHRSNMKPPIAVPATMATKVDISRMPLARDRSRSGSISGRMPYFAGLKNVACSAIRKSTA